VLESRWAPGVLVDNKSVAEIWREVSCPRRVLGGGVARRHRPGETAGASLRRRPITLTGGKLYADGKGAPATRRGFNFSTRSDSQPERVGIDPIEDILGREVVSSNRRAVNRSWRVRKSGRLLGGERAASRGGSLGAAPCERQGMSESAVEGQAPPAERRRELVTGESRVTTNRTQRKLSRRKTASLR